MSRRARQRLPSGLRKPEEEIKQQKDESDLIKMVDGYGEKDQINHLIKMVDGYMTKNVFPVPLDDSVLAYVAKLEGSSRYLNELKNNNNMSKEDSPAQECICHYLTKPKISSIKWLTPVMAWGCQVTARAGLGA
eukprot:GHVO01052814.1.p1 GENE.GHVO01052814.1~~GHVO01052814.1.p1  ORF type:complete len:134 (-),score=9.39 GHVO01052814.1:105-506(-)